MKLKKLLALALAGVMAVSMLAGCKGNDKTEDPTGEPTDTSIAAALNKKQDDDKIDFKIDFVYDATVEDAVKKYLDVNGNDKDKSDEMVDYLEKILDVNDENMDAFKGYDGVALSGNLDGTQTDVHVFRVENKNAAGVAAEAYDAFDEHLPKLELKGEDSGKTLNYAFTYAGKVATVSVENDNYGTDTYVVLILSCTTTTSVAAKA